MSQHEFCCITSDWVLKDRFRTSQEKRKFSVERNACAEVWELDHVTRSLKLSSFHRTETWALGARDYRRCGLESWPLNNKGFFLYGRWKKLNFHWNMWWTTQGLILNSWITWSDVEFRTITPATVQIGGNMRSREVTQEMITAIPSGNVEKLNWIRERRI